MSNVEVVTNNTYRLGRSVDFLWELMDAGVITREEFMYAVKSLDAALKVFGVSYVRSEERAIAIALVALYLSCVMDKVLRRAMEYASRKYGVSVSMMAGHAISRVRGQAWLGCVEKLNKLGCVGEFPPGSEDPGFDAYVRAVSSCGVPIKTAESLFR